MPDHRRRIVPPFEPAPSPRPEDVAHFKRTGQVRSGVQHGKQRLQLYITEESHQELVDLVHLLGKKRGRKCTMQEAADDALRMWKAKVKALLASDDGQLQRKL